MTEGCCTHQQHDASVSIAVYRTRKAIHDYRPLVYGLKVIPEDDVLHDHLDRIIVNLSDVYEHITSDMYDRMVEQYFKHPEILEIASNYDISTEGPWIILYRYDIEEDWV